MLMGPDVIGGSVYESESGELTNGIPSGEVIDVEPVKTERRDTAEAPASASEPGLAGRLFAALDRAQTPKEGAEA